MYYFYKDESYEIVQRKHRYNSEALDGLIKYIEKEEPVFLLVHIPNSSFGWDVSIVNKYKAEEGYKKWEEVGTQKDVEEGKPFYSLVLSSGLEDYIRSDQKFKLDSENSDIDLQEFKEDTSVKSEVPEVSQREVNKKGDKKKKYQMHLMRDEETPIKS